MASDPSSAPDQQLAARAGIRRIVPGHAPNCSSAGSVVSMALFSVVASSAVLAVWAPWLTRWRRGEPTPEDGPPPVARREPGGGVVHHAASGTRLHVSPEVMEELEAQGLPVLRGTAPAGGLSAPTEVHLSMTGRCPVACSACYLDAHPDRPPPDPHDLLPVLDRLAEQGVMEVAFGGGEAIGRLDVVGLGRAARDRGMVPNLTTSGFGLTERIAAQLAEVFGQVNISLDGLGETYEAARGWQGASRGLAALDRLVAAGARVGVNTLLSRPLLEERSALEDLGAVLRERGAHEWQWLRFKPAGRGAGAWSALAAPVQQLDALWSRAQSLLAVLDPLVLRWDCALVPFLAHAGGDPARAARMGVRGCPGGHGLAARDHRGRWAPCSFSATASDPGLDLRTAWHTEPTIRAWRGRASAPPEPCASCAWQSVCRGGCRVVSDFLTGEPLAPDPQCPRVRAHEARL